VHYGPRPPSATFDLSPCVGSFKPAGFWYCEGDEWADWCRDNEFGFPENFRYRTTFYLHPQRVLQIATVEQLLQFNAAYGRPALGDPRFESIREIDWSRVAESWDGVEIIPYARGALNASWYWGWDCASGCVWSERAVVDWPGFTEEVTR
jgi:hypothetical protein